ncbi:MAG: hypothetical protein ACT4PV_07395 [Planctomycetaceae bacterium]
MSRTASVFLLALVLLVLAVYFLVKPPPGFGDNLAHHLAIPFVLIATALGLIEGVRTRAHIGQLVGALRALTGRAGKAVRPEVKVEAIGILIHALRGENETARRTAAGQLEHLTGQKFGEDRARWEQWWRENREQITRSES